MQVEQDLILSRVLVDIFSHDLLKQELAFRGGTALHKLFISPAARYSEDIDLVRTSKGPITPIIDALRDCLEPWLGKAKTIRKKRSFKLFFYFNPETLSSTRLRIKIEINIEEIFSVLDRLQKPYSINSDWFSGKADINTFQLDELIATKIRALYQRSKGRDLFDLWLVLKEKELKLDRAIKTFRHYMKLEGNCITRENFEENLNEKLSKPEFLSDIGPLISPTLKRDGIEKGWDLHVAAEKVMCEVIRKL